MSKKKKLSRSQKKRLKKRLEEYKEEKRSIVAGTIVASLFFGGIGTFFLLVALTDRGKIKNSVDWPGTKGKVEFVSYKKMHTSMKSHSSKTRYKPYVEYTYYVNAEKYTNDVLYFDSHYLPLDEAREIVENYRVGEEVLVFYNPKEPSKSVLNLEASGGNLGMYIGAAIFYLIVLIIVGVAFGKSKELRKAG